MQQNQSIKVILVGELDLKRAFVDAIIRPGFLSRSYTQTVGVDFFYVDGRNNERFQVWDLAGQERFISSLRTYCRNAKAVIYFNASPSLQEYVENLAPDIIEINRTDFDSEMDCLDAIAAQLEEDRNELLVGYNQNVFFTLENSSEEPLRSINEIQKNTIEGMLKFILDDITDISDQEGVIDGLKALISEALSTDQIENLKQQGVWESVKQVRNILDHPYPQNRIENYPYFGAPSDPNIVVYQNAEGVAAFEQAGLLNLTAWNDENTSVTKEAVVAYVKELVNQRIEEVQNRQVNHLNA